MLNLAVLCPSQTDATSFYRGIGPLAELRRTRNDLNLVFLSEINWATIKLADAVFMQRPFTNAHMQIAEIVKRNRLPLWADYDDDLFCVPEWNPCAATYAKPEIQKNIATIAAMADVITVSTESLMHRFTGLNQNVCIVNNAIDLRLVGPCKTTELTDAKEGKLVLWRGSRTHKKDLNLAAEACIKLAQKHPTATWFFLGDTPWFADYMPHGKTITAEAVDPIEYHELLQKIAPDIMIVPLVDCEFNRSKSNIALLEGTWAGAHVLAPAWKEWALQGVSLYKNTDDFCSKLDTCLASPREHLLQKASKTWENIETSFLLEQTNKQRNAIIAGFLCRKN